ncbi:MAG: tRNA-dihydrouridine synthase, partial [Ornithinimicrobium sp.]
MNPTVTDVAPPVGRPLQIGRHTFGSPVVLAPMAGITNRAFRRLCRHYGAQGSSAGGASGASSLYVSEMITSRALVERTPISMRLIEHDEDESPRSIQLY